MQRVNNTRIEIHKYRIHFVCDKNNVAGKTFTSDATLKNALSQSSFTPQSLPRSLKHSKTDSKEH